MKKTTGSFFLMGVLMLAACAKSAVPLTVENVCQSEIGTIISVEGYLLLPEFMDISDNSKSGTSIYELFLAAQPDGKSEIVKTFVFGTGENEINHIAELPMDGYTQKDLQIYTDSGEIAGSRDLVKVTGEVLKRKNSCVLKINKIEMP